MLVLARLIQDKQPPFLYLSSSVIALNRFYFGSQNEIVEVHHTQQIFTETFLIKIHFRQFLSPSARGGI
jgi:hypothetical protein